MHVGEDGCLLTTNGERYGQRRGIIGDNYIVLPIFQEGPRPTLVVVKPIDWRVNPKEQKHGLQQLLEQT